MHWVCNYLKMDFNMKHLHFVLFKGVYPFRTGGMEIFNYYFIQSLIKEGYKISYSSYIKYLFDNGSDLECNKMTELKPVKIFAPIQTILYLLFHRNIDNVIFSYSRGHWIMWMLYHFLLKIVGIKYTAIIHLGEKPLKHKHHNIIKKFLQGAKNVIAVSNDIKKNYDEMYGIDCKVIPPLVPFEISDISVQQLRHKYGIPTNCTVICMVGTIKKMKNPDTVIHAISQMTSKELEEINPCIVFAGSGNQQQAMKELASNLEISDRVFFLGNIAKENVNEIYKLSDIYVIASDYEGTSVSLLEAMYNSKMIIASKAIGIMDMVTENSDCMMFEIQNNTELKNAIIKIVTNKNFAINISTNAKATYDKHYNYKNIIEEYKNIL